MSVQSNEQNTVKLVLLEKKKANPLIPIQKYAEDHPEATEYYVDDEGRAQKILLAISAVLNQMLEDIDNVDVDDKAKLLRMIDKYTNSALTGNALDLIRKMTDKNQLAVFGLAIRASRIVLQ